MRKDPPPIKGIWYEAPRKRWRVKLSFRGEIFTRSYHASFEDAYAAWLDAKRQIKKARTCDLPPRPPTPLEQFIYRKQ